MLTVTCQDDAGQVLATTHHIRPQSLWPTIQSVYSEYYSTNAESLSMNHRGQVFSMGMMPLGWVKITNTVVFNETVMDVLSDTTYGEDNPVNFVADHGGITIN